MFEQAFKNIDDVRFQSQTEKHELSHLYEAKIKNMGNVSREAAKTAKQPEFARLLLRELA